MKGVRHIAFAACLAVLAKHTMARAPLVSLTVSILSNTTATPFQATFDRSDYAYPLPQTGLNTFGFAGELYVPDTAECADDTIGLSVRKYAKPSHANGIVFLPYRGCRAEWEQIVHDETEGGRAAGALLYSLKDDAAQAAERAVVDLTHVRAPVWMVSQVTGQYLVGVMRQLSSSHPSTQLPRAPSGVEFTELQDSVRRAVHAAVETTQPNGPRTFVTISRSSVDVASADRNFFLKAMIGVGITGIVCFVVAMVVRYFDCVRGARWNARVWDAPRVVQTKRVLQQHELDAMPCAVVTEAHLGLEVPPLAQVRVPRIRSCPHLAVTSDALEMGRVYSIQNAVAPNKDTWDTVECAICLDELRLGDVVRSLPCPHVFHAVCIDRWLLFQSSVCPLCKRDTIFDRSS